LASKSLNHCLYENRNWDPFFLLKKMIIVGKKGSGKTFLVLKELKKYQSPLIVYSYLDQCYESFDSIHIDLFFNFDEYDDFSCLVLYKHHDIIVFDEIDKKNYKLLYDKFKNSRLSKIFVMQSLKNIVLNENIVLTT